MIKHFLQSTAWKTFQEDLGRVTFEEKGDGWHYLAILEHGRFNKRLYCPYGPTANSQQSFEKAIDSLVQLGKKHGVTFLRVEPTNPDFSTTLRNLHWIPVTYQQLQPSHTRIISLEESEADIIANMSQPARNIHRNYHKKGIEIHSSYKIDDIDILLKFVHEVADRTNIKPHNDAYFRQQSTSLFPTKNASLWYATINGTPIAAALFYDDNHGRIYAHAGASSLPEHRRLNASSALLSTAITDAKQKNMSFFDLYGIAPKDAKPSHPWHGFTSFKRSFGGNDVNYAGAWDFPLRKSSYYLYRAYQYVRK